MCEPVLLILPIDLKGLNGTMMRTAFDETKEGAPRETLAACAAIKIPAPVAS
ncbi:hypothetical protein AB4Y85_14010 [Microvirga sp. 2YAF29]|uniref:hypothetical protein n=1 Tax=Microvirga sp. 2YAF29 TaxID=3233031 RepID=UPI003F9BD740